jgi:hypothetical protein
MEPLQDPFLQLLNQQLRGVNSSLVVCKWPVTLTSCFFLTLLCWDMAGDKGGWSQALWVPIVGVVMIMTIWLLDHALYIFGHPRSKPDKNLPLEFALSALHQSSVLQPSSENIEVGRETNEL